MARKTRASKLEEPVPIQSADPQADKIILDEIALEGLSGVTLNRLLKLLDAQGSVKTSTLNSVWPVLIDKYLRYPNGVNVQAFHLKPRATKGRKQSAQAESSKSQSLEKKVFFDKQMKLPTQTVGRHAIGSARFLYPVQDGLIMGSCDSYQQRVNITRDLVAKTDKEGAASSLKFLKTKYGLDNVYFVASHHIRAKAILPPWADPNIDIKLREYCVLEMIGKSRFTGIVFPNDKTFGRYRIMLMAKGLITQYQETNTSPIQHHLRRFSHSKCKVELMPKRMESLDSDDEIEDDSEELPLSKICYDPNKMKVDRGILAIVYEVIAQSRSGCTQLDIRRQLNMPKSHLRNHLKNLISLKLIYSVPPKDPASTFRIYKTTLKSIKRKKSRKQDELAKPMGIMARWDEVDLRAKKIIGQKRSSFSQAEDSLLILCRITSILIEPSLKLSWCVNKRLVRDLLHKELVEAHDKTSDACLRRIKYLKQLPNNIMSISELTAELRDDLDINRLISNRNKSVESEEKLNKLFVQVLKRVRAKTPTLLGITTNHQADLRLAGGNNSLQLHRNLRPVAVKGLQPALGGGQHQRPSSDGGSCVGSANEMIEIADYNELRSKFELIDCQSVASITMAPTYERAKNLVDVKYNNACLVTMAYVLTASFEQPDVLDARRWSSQWLLQRFYSNFPDKLVNSVLSKLKKQTLLTRKGASMQQQQQHDQAPVYRAKTRLALKLNQGVQFLMNRYHSTSLIQLAQPFSQLNNDCSEFGRCCLSESNEMGPFAMLSSLCSMSSFQLDMRLRIPDNVVGIDQGNENFRNLSARANPNTKEILARFLSRCGASARTSARRSPPKPAPPIVVQEQAAVVASGSGGCEQQTSQEPVFATLEPVSCIELPMDIDDLSGSDNGANLGSRQQQQLHLEEPTMRQPCKMDDSRRALFLLRHELKTQALDKCGSLADCLIVQPCNIKFYFTASQVNQQEFRAATMEPFSTFLDRAKPTDVTDDDASTTANQTPTRSARGQQPPDWLVECFRLPKVASDDELLLSGASGRDDDDDDCADHFEAQKVRVKYSARLWKWLDGNVHLATLLKLIESLLAWIIVFPGIERQLLQREFGHLMPDEHLHELLDLMESLELIASQQLKQPERKPQLFGYSSGNSGGGGQMMIAYEPTAGAFVRFCQLLDHCK